MTLEDVLKDKKIHPSDKKLAAAYFIFGTAFLAFGAMIAIIPALINAPGVPFFNDRTLYYKVLTLHGVMAFFFFLTFFQAALLIGTCTWLFSGRRLYSLKLGWISFITMLVGAALAILGILSGADVLYTAFPPLSLTFQNVWMVYLGYSVVAFGAILLCMDFLLTILKGARELGGWRKIFHEMHISTFAALMGIVIAIPCAILAINVFGSAFMASIGLGTLSPVGYRMDYHVFFHLFHYIPALALVGVCYVLVELVADAKSVYTKTVAKLLFLLYPVTVPPTFLYHLLVDPTISLSVKQLGSTLSLMIGTPTILHMFIILGMLEAKMRSAGYGGMLRWMRRLPWKNPAFVGMAWGMISLGLAGVLAYSLIQESASSALHSTFIVPAYIHAMVAGGATLIFMGAAFYGVVGVTRKQLWKPAIASLSIYILMVGIFVRAIAGSMAGLMGVPRRTFSIPFENDAAAMWMNASEGIGGSLMFVGILLFSLVLLITAVAGKRGTTTREILKGLELREYEHKVDVKKTPSSLVPGTVFLIISLIILTVVFEIMRAMPLKFG